MASPQKPEIFAGSIKAAGELSYVELRSAIQFLSLVHLAAFKSYLGIAGEGGGPILAADIADASANGQALVMAADYATMRALLDLEVGTDVQGYDAELAALAGLTSAADKGMYFTGAGAAEVFDLTSFSRTALGRSTAALWRTDLGLDTIPVLIQVAASDLVTDIEAGTGVAYFRAPFAFTLTAVRASALVAPTDAAIIIDINEAGSTVLSTKLTIDATEKTSTTATPAVISDAAIADDAEITIDFDQVGSTVAGKGVIVTLIGHRPF